MLRDAERDVSVADAFVSVCGDRGERRASGASEAGGLAGTPPTGRPRPATMGVWRDEEGDDAARKVTNQRVEHYIARMGGSPTDERIQEEGSRMLANLAGTAYGRAQIAEAGGIDALIGAMDAHAKVKQV